MTKKSAVTHKIIRVLFSLLYFITRKLTTLKMNGHQIDVSPLVGQVRQTRRVPTAGSPGVDEARTRAMARATSYRSKQRSMSLPLERMSSRKSVSSITAIKTPRDGLTTPRKIQEENSFTPVCCHILVRATRPLPNKQYQ